MHGRVGKEEIKLKQQLHIYDTSTLRFESSTHANHDSTVNVNHHQQSKW